jgi:hypothetical protein
LLTKDRVGGALAIAAAIVGLVLVFTTHASKADSDDDTKAGTSAPTSQVHEPDPDQTQPPSLAPTQPAQPGQRPKKDTDDDG